MATSFRDALDHLGKQVLIIGGSSGIGNGIAQAYRECGAEVMVTGTRPLASDYDGLEGSDLTGLTYHQLDVSDREAAAQWEPEFARLDVLVQCQGIVRYRREEFARPGWDDVIDVNLHSVMDVATRFKPMLQQAQGSMIVVSSIAAFGAALGNPAYAASKAGAASLVKTLGMAWAADDIRVNGIAPGMVPTKLTEVTTKHPSRLEATLQAIPASRLGTPADMAGAALFLSSDLASYVVGQTLIVDGGLLLA